MSSADRFSLSESLLYSSPVKTVAGELNFTEFIPQSGSSFGAGENFSIRVSSPDSFIDPKKCWLKFTLSFTGTTDAGNQLNALGGAAVIKRVDTIVSGVEIESIDNYNHYCSMVYKRQPLTYLQLLRETEKSAYDGGATIGSHTSSSQTSRVINHPLRVAIMEGHSNLIPVPFLRGGIEFRFTMESLLSNIATTGGSGGFTAYSISNVRLVCGMVKPLASYLQQFQQKLESGGEATLPIQIVRNLNFVPTASTSQEAILSPGYLSSVRSVMGAYRANGAGFNSDARNNLTSYFWMIGSKRYPLNKQISTSDDDAENVMFALASIDNTYNHLRTPTLSATTGHLIYYNFCADSGFGNGEPCSDGQVRLIQTYSAAPNTSGRVDLYVTYDAKLRVGAASVTVDALNV